MPEAKRSCGIVMVYLVPACKYSNSRSSCMCVYFIIGTWIGVLDNPVDIGEGQRSFLVNIGQSLTTSWT